VTEANWETVVGLRDELNLSQAALAAGTDVTQTAVSYYERRDAVPDGGTVADTSGVVLDRIDEGLAVEDTVRRLRSLAEGAIGWDRITSIERVETDEAWVYDLEVAETHNYIAEGLVSHNSALLQYVDNIAPRSVYTSGKGASAAGLTAAAVRDDFGEGQQWTLEAGALVLADRGVAAVDELDKMDSSDQSAMHEALEQQSYHPETELLLADGRRVEIGDLVDERMADNPAVVDGLDCELLPVDDIGLHTVDLDTKITTKTGVDRISRHEAPEQFIRVEFSNGRSVRVTPEHPMFVDSDGDLGTVEAREIAEGAFVPAPRTLPNSSEPVALAPEPQVGKEKDVALPETLTPALGEILGLLVAEGHAYAGSAHEIGFSNQDEQLLARMERLVQSAFGIESCETTNAAGTVTKRWISTNLYRWFESNVPEVMATAREKRIPAAVLGASEEVIRRFLVGAFAGDGGVESEAMAFSTASEGLARDYADALSKIGVASRIHHDTSEDSWKTYVMGDSTERFVEAVVRTADDRYEDAQAFAERSAETPRHHDVLPTSAAREIRDLRKLLGLRRTGQYRPHLDEGYGVQRETVRDELDTLRERIESVREALDDAESLGDVRSAIGWSGRALAGRLDGVTGDSIQYAESGGYDASRREALTERAESAVREALAAAERRIEDLADRTDLRYYRVRSVETVPNDGHDWVYDVTVEPTHTFVGQGVVLHNSISVSKAGINATLKSRCSLLGAANPSMGRFDRYEPIAEQIDLAPPLISRFDLIFTVTDQPDEEEDARLAEHIIQTNYAGELHTHRTETSTSNYSEEEVERVTEEVAPTIEPELLRKYVAYAKRNCFPTMTEEAKSEIQQFYVDLRANGSGEDSPVPVTARKLEALVRLAEASARVRLSDTVEQEDARRAVEIARYCLEDIGLDPETGELDADVIETGTSKSQRDRVRNLLDIIAEIEREYDEGAPVDVILERCEEIDISENKAEHEIDKLKQKGEVYEPQPDHLRTT
jgi:replicative DNA helicase Mcm